MRVTGKNMNKRTFRFVRNSIFSFLQQLIAIISGLLLSQLILSHYGSAINGTIASITQFFSIITILQGGVGTVARLAFYKPLAVGDTARVSIAYKTVSNFFKKFSIVFFVYLILIACIYPIIVDTGYNFTYVFSLVIILGFASVFEYLFGQSSQLLLMSDQKGYIYYIIQNFCLVFATIVCSVMIKNGSTIHTVKFAYAVFFTLRPIAIYMYVCKHYGINKRDIEDKKLLSQRNSALIRHFAFYIHTSTDIVVLTLFSNILWVSVYSVHRYVVSGLSSLVTSILGNVEIVFGDMFARDEAAKFREQIYLYDLLTKYISTVCFSTCMISISSFINVYTSNVEDINYYYPTFAFILVLGEMIYCMSLTYQNIYIAAGHIKKTEWIAVCEAIINLSISLILVKRYNILGVAIGTLIAMIFKAIANIYYMQTKVFKMPIGFIIKSNLACFLSTTLSHLLFNNILPISPSGYIIFFEWAAIVFVGVALLLLILYTIFFNELMTDLIRKNLK